MAASFFIYAREATASTPSFTSLSSTAGKFAPMLHQRYLSFRLKLRLRARVQTDKRWVQQEERQNSRKVPEKPRTRTGSAA